MDKWKCSPNFPDDLLVALVLHIVPIDLHDPVTVLEAAPLRWRPGLNLAHKLSLHLDIYTVSTWHSLPDCTYLDISTLYLLDCRYLLYMQGTHLSQLVQIEPVSIVVAPPVQAAQPGPGRGGARACNFWHSVISWFSVAASSVLISSLIIYVSYKQWTSDRWWSGYNAGTFVKTAISRHHSPHWVSFRGW